MNLRRQLLLVSLLLLSLPWAGCQFIREIEGALRSGQEQALQATAQAVATAMRDRPELLYPYRQRLDSPPDPRISLYASPGPEPVIMDGYADGWGDSDYHRFSSQPGQPPLALSYQAVTRGERLYLLLRVQDPEVVYHNPGLSLEPNGDRLLLRTWQDGRRQQYVIATAAPGSVQGQFAGPRERGVEAGRLRGYWQDAVDGYTLELELPLSFTGGRLGLYVVNVNRRSGQAVTTAGNIGPLDSQPPPWLIYSPLALQRAMTPFRDQGGQLQIVDQSGWIIGNPGLGAGPDTRADNAESRPQTFWLLRALYRSVLRQNALPATAAEGPWGKLQGPEVVQALAGSSATRWYRDPAASTRTHLSAAAPILAAGSVVGAVVARESSEEYLSLTDKAFSRLLVYSLVALGAATLGLLGYASVLSWRIRSLSRAVAGAVTTDGRVLSNFRRSEAADEIGELSRSYADLLAQVRSYNDYLGTLSRKLAHELRTPIAVIQSSLDNLEQLGDGDGSGIYRQRAREGLARLNKILTAMSEARQLEDSIRHNPLQDMDLVPLLREVFEAYRAIYPEHQLALVIEPPAAFIHGAPELIVQALDKLLDNAASFCPPGGQIDIRLAGDGPGWELSVSNAGPVLPPDLADRLFEPMVSAREHRADTVHLGLGLHMVRLISDYLGGRAGAANLPDNRGVRMTLWLPTAPDPG